jgi:hypothetical protein
MLSKRIALAMSVLFTFLNMFKLHFYFENICVNNPDKFEMYTIRREIYFPKIIGALAPNGR